MSAMIPVGSLVYVPAGVDIRTNTEEVVQACAGDGISRILSRFAQENGTLLFFLGDEFIIQDLMFLMGWSQERIFLKFPDGGSFLLTSGRGDAARLGVHGSLHMRVQSDGTDVGDLLWSERNSLLLSLASRNA